MRDGRFQNLRQQSWMFDNQEDKESYHPGSLLACLFVRGMV